VWAIDVPSGRHQLRVASIDAATSRGGSVYLDVNIPEGTALPPAALVASRFLSRMPTVFADKRLAPWTTVMPTATRVFPEADVLTITVPHHSPNPATARLSSATGDVVWEGRGVPIESASAVQFIVSLDRLGSPVCDLTVETSHGRVRTTIGIVPPQTGPTSSTGKIPQHSVARSQRGAPDLFRTPSRGQRAGATARRAASR
jgi:hypothetical protein